MKVEISRPDKVLFPGSGIDKRGLADYYERVATVMLPHVRDRALTMHRFPDGIEEEGFFQKHAPDHFPDWVRTVELEKEDGSVEHVVIDRAETLVFLADQACITPHVSLSRVDRPRHPDRLIIDLDPAGDDFDSVRRAAFSMRALFDEVDLKPFVMTTGSRGVHVVAPLDRGSDFDTVRGFARSLVEIAARRAPGDLTVEQRTEKRNERVYLDYLRNGYAQTTVAPYAVRAKAEAPIATPIDWAELEDESLGPRSYTIGNLFRRLSQRDDPWTDIQRHARSLEKRFPLLDRLRNAATQ